MDKNVNDIDNLFKSSLGSYTEVPPPAVWDALERRLDGRDKKKAALPYRWMWFMALLLVISVAGTMAWRMMKADDTAGIPALQADAASVQQVATTAKDNNSSPVTQQVEATANTNSNSEVSHSTPANNSDASTNDNNPTDNHHNTQNISRDDLGTATAQTTGNEATNTNNEPTETPVETVIAHRRTHNIQVVETDREAGSLYQGAVASVATGEDAVTFGRKRKVAEPVQLSDDEDGVMVMPTTNNNSVAAHTTRTTPTTAQAAAPRRATHHVARLSRTTRTTTVPATAHRALAAAPVSAAAPANAKAKVNATAVRQKNVNQPEHTAIAKIKTNVAAATPIAAATAPKANRPAIAHSTTISTPDSKVATTQQPSIARAATATSHRAKPATKAKASAVTPAATSSPAAVAAKTPVARPATTPALKATKSTTARSATAAAATPVRSKVGKPAATTSSKAVAVVSKTAPAIKMASAKAVPTAKAASTARIAAATTNAATTKVARGTTSTTAAVPATTTKPATAKTAALASNKVSKTKAVKTTAPKATNISATAMATRTTTAGRKAAKAAPTVAAAPQKRTVTSVAATAPSAAYKPYANTVPLPGTTVPVPAAVMAGVKTLLAKAINTFKADSTQPKPKLAANETPLADSNNGKKQNSFFGFTGGVKVGFEGGVASGSARKLVIAPFLEKPLSGRFSLLLQPAIKASKAQNKSLQGNQSYYEIDNSSTKITYDSFLVFVVQPGDTQWRRNYTYRQSHDSVDMTYSVGGSYIEAEMPIMLKYAVSPKLSVYGGVNLAYSRRLGINQNISRTTFTVVDSSHFVVTPYPAPPISSVITHSGSPFSSYTTPLYPSPTGGSFRVGYMLGFSYEFRRRWLLDGLLQQTPTKSDMRGGYNINKALSTTYFRLSIGYKLFQ